MKKFEVERFYRAEDHPLGDCIYIKIESEFATKEEADKFRNKELGLEYGVVGEEITKEEYILATEKIQCSNCKKIIEEGYEVNDGLYHYCSDECLYTVMSEADYKELYDQGYAFWTTFED